MKKLLKYSMLVTLIATQLTGVASDYVLYASEIEPYSEVGSKQVTNEESKIIQSEVSNMRNSETKSEVVNAVDGITATISIDSDGVIKDEQAATPSAYLKDQDLEKNENLSTYENEKRITANSGESSIQVSPSDKSKSLSEELKDKRVYYVMDKNGNIDSGSTKEPRSYDGNLITVLNGKIIDSDRAIARTNGGYDTTFYVYSSIDDLKSNTNGVPISGGGFDATYIDSLEEDGVYYDHIKISGYEGYTQAGNMQIVPEEMMKARSYYTAEDGDWVYYSAIDPLISKDYDRIVIGEAPSSVVDGTKYYSDDDENYYTEPILTDEKSSKVAVSYNSYFQNLPFRSASSYTASDYNAYLKAKGKTSSEYYNETTAFTDAQSKENINSLMIFAMANHESAYGTSSYAHTCNNFFGRGAIDSDPAQACKYYSYPTATDGILAQALFLENGYFDILDWRYSGTHVGNKASGMNVKYASDVDWGKKISNHAYMMDQYEDGEEENKYPILKITGTSLVYNDEGLTTKVKSSSDSGNYNFYDLSQMAGTDNTVNVVALQQNSNGYQIYVPTAVKDDSSVDCSYTDSMRGSYPNYDGRSNVSVGTDTANYSCDYKSFSNNEYWIKKTGTTVINDKSVPYGTKDIYEYYPDGKVKYKFVVTTSDNKIKYAYGYNEAGSIINKYIYQPNTVYGQNHGSKIATKYYVSKGALTQARTYDSNNKLIYIYEYYSGATLSNSGSKIRYRFNIDPNTGYIKDTYSYTEGADRKRNKVYVYDSKTRFGSQGNHMKFCFMIQPGTSYITKTYHYRTGHSVDGFDKIYTYQAHTKYGTQSTKKYYDVFWLKGKNKEIAYAIKYKNGVKSIKYTYDPGTIYGQNHGSHIANRYYY